MTARLRKSRATMVPERLPRGAKPLAAVVSLLVLVACAAAWRWTGGTRAWQPAEVSVAFWAWLNETPSDEEVESARRSTGAQLLFMRAGQFDHEGGRVKRIRTVEGKYPRGVSLHLVYNATPALLTRFGRIEAEELAATAVSVFSRDARRGTEDGARIEGLQLDLDVPTRLLSHYGRVLAEVRRHLPSDAKLSVTGLPTWLGSKELGAALSHVDFWVPQFYGAEIPRRLDQVTPISSPRRVARDAAQARALGKPFYAGLAAYGYSALYTERGDIVGLRGDLHVELAASHAGLELVERRRFAASADEIEGGDASGAAGGWRYLFRAREELFINETVMREGEWLVFYLTGAEGLRAAARAVREHAGEPLLGICVFRLPTAGDRTTLRLAQAAAALADREAHISTSVRAEPIPAREAGAGNLLRLTAVNDGMAGARIGEGALTITISMPRGRLRGVSSLEGFDAVESLCRTFAPRAARDGANGDGSLSRCSPRRADVIRLSARSWSAGAHARAGLSFDGEPPAELEAHVAVGGEDNREWSRAMTLKVAAAK